MARPLVENASDQTRNRHVGKEVVAKDPLAGIDIRLDEVAAVFGKVHVAVGHIREAQELQRLDHRKQIVDLHLQGGGDVGQIGLTVIGGPASASIKPASLFVETRGKAMPRPVPGNPSGARLSRSAGVRLVMRA